jgi:hypothetical protein
MSGRAGILFTSALLMFSMLAGCIGGEDNDE